MRSSVPFEMSYLLNLAGFRVRSATRADCARCSGHSRSTVSFTSNVAYCHRCEWTRNKVTLARELGLLNVDPALRAALKQEAQERRRLYGLAAKLLDAVRTAESEARHEVRAMDSLRRKAGERLAAICGGSSERFVDEADFCWAALQFVADHELRAHAGYILAALAAPAKRVHWALHADDRVAMIEAALELGWVAGKRGYFEVRT